MLDLPAKRLGVIGLAFKENTDDLRESPVVSMLEQLIGKGRDVRVFDPHIQLDIDLRKQSQLHSGIDSSHRAPDGGASGWRAWLG